MKRKPSMKSCVIDPAKENWGTKGDSEVYHAAKAGIRQAIVEIAKRTLRDRKRKSAK